MAVEASASMTLTGDPMLVTTKFLVRLELDFLFLSVFWTFHVGSFLRDTAEDLPLMTVLLETVKCTRSDS